MNIETQPQVVTSDEHPLGLVEMTTEEYHAGPGISKSHLDVIAGKSPLHYWQKYINPDREPEEPTPALVLGNAIHTAILEPDFLSDRYVQAPEYNRRTKDGKALYEQFAAENPGKIVLSAEDFTTVLNIRDAAMRHPKISRLLNRGRVEQKIFAIDPETGELIKCCVDYLPDSGEMNLDLKSTDDASPSSFARSVANFRYDVQAAWYQGVQDTAFGEHPEHWGLLAFEKKPPYAMGIYLLRQDDIARAHRTARNDFLRIVHHRRLNYWPDYAMEPQELILPGWMKRD